MLKNISFMQQYLAFWIILLIIGLVVIFVQGGISEPITCINGSVVFDEAECPECLVDTDCTGIDKVCNLRNKCESKRCISDSDCSIGKSSCVYDRCLYTGTDWQDS